MSTRDLPSPRYLLLESSGDQLDSLLINGLCHVCFGWLGGSGMRLGISRLMTCAWSRGVPFTLPAVVAVRV